MEQIIQFDIRTIDPNIIYVALVIGLWLVVTATYIPGTGIAEAVASVLLIGVVILLMSIGANWLAVVVLALGVLSFLLLPFLNPRWARYMELALIAQAVGGYFLFPDRHVSAVIIGITVLISIAYHRVILMPAIQAQQEPVNNGNLVGIQGRVVAPLRPAGTVRVNGELWTARSADPLDTDTEVVVVEQKGLELTVKKSKR